MTFGAGIIAIMMIIQFVKLLIDTAIRGYTLHSIYGWSVHILGAIFASITALLRHLGTKDHAQTTTMQSEVEMQQMPTSPLIPEEVKIHPSVPQMYPNVNQHPQTSTNKGFLSLN